MKSSIQEPFSVVLMFLVLSYIYFTFAIECHFPQNIQVQVKMKKKKGSKFKAIPILQLPISEFPIPKSEFKSLVIIHYNH